MQFSGNNESNVDNPNLLDGKATDLLRLHHSPLIRAIYMGVGFIALLLGAIGIILPVLPTTPFVLLAAACFARGSERFHNKLISNRYAGPVILEWRLHRSIPLKAKRLAYITIVISFSISIFIVPEIWQKIMLAAIACILTIFLSRIPVR